jgi:ATP-binding cassette, subfamily C, bacteriocin exporter
VCEQLGLKGFVESLPSGFNTYIGEQGAALSGGQQQKLAIARILYREPEIFVLDEATSSLDSESESYVQSIIRQLRLNGKTVVLIAHRFSSIINADKIMVLKNGQVAEEGDHNTLLSIKGFYYAAWQKQFPAVGWKD